MDNIALSISKEIVNPIVKAKIDSMVIEALGGKDDLVKKVVDQICQQKVDGNGRISTYNSENKYSWLDFVLTDQVKKVIELEIKKQIVESAETIKDAVKQLISTKKGQSAVATALVDGLSKSFEKSWTSTFDIKFINKTE